MKYTFLVILSIAQCVSVFSKNQEFLVIDYDQDLKTFGYVNLQGDIIVPRIYYFDHMHFEGDFLDEGKMGEFIDGMAVVADSMHNYGYVNRNGIESIPCQFKMVRHFREGFAAVQSNNGKWGYIDKQGKVVIPFQYDKADSFCDGFAFVANDNSSEFLGGFIDKNGKMICPPKYKWDYSSHGFYEGLAAVKDAEGNAGYIDKRGKVIIPMKFDFTSDFHNGKAVVGLNGLGIIDNLGNQLLPCSYGHLSVSDYEEGVYTDYSDNRVINLKTGKTVVEKGTYDRLDVYGYLEGLLIVTKGGKDGAIDKQGRLVIPIEYDVLFHNSAGLIQFWRNNKCGYLNLLGEVIIPNKYDKISEFTDKGFAFANLGKYVTIIDKTGNPVTPYIEETNNYGAINSMMEMAVKQMAKSDVDENIPISPQKNTETFVVIFANERYMEGNIDDVLFACRDGEIFKEYCIQALGIPASNVHYREKCNIKPNESRYKMA